MPRDLEALNSTDLFPCSSGGQKSKVCPTDFVRGLLPSGGSRGAPFPGLSQLLEAACTPWLVASSSVFTASTCQPPSVSDPPASSLRTLVIPLGPPRIIPHLRVLSLIIPAKSLLPRKVPGMSRGTPWGASFHSPQTHQQVLALCFPVGFGQRAASSRGWPMGGD